MRRSPSASSRDWSDQFSFNACLRPQQGFDYPIYVYSAGGSPYWRQYISARSSPPSTEYHFDYVFHVASVPLARTIAYHVLECGSVPVIKSCISRTAEMKGWRETGIVFYVLKPVRPGSPPKSELWVTPEGYILGIYSLRFHFWLLKVKLKYFKKVLFGFFFYVH